MTAIDLDTIQYLRTLSQEPSFMQAVIEAFIRDTEVEIHQLKEAYKIKDTVMMQHIAHKYKSSCRNLGATKLMAICLHIENMVREGDGASPIIANKLILLEEEAKKAVDELNNLK